jgi:macrodomain Ter protein organizer (MatP/YcbG family)
MKNKTTPKTLRLNQIIWDELEQLSIQEGTNVSHEIRQAVKDRLKKKLKK